MLEPKPRLMLAGLAGGGGKTLVSLALALAARRAGVEVRAFKKGPDYIDAGWLAWASKSVARNLDTYLMGFAGAVDSFARHACADGLNVIEGNRGLYDGCDALGTHSTAELARAMAAPVVLVVDATKATRTLAACVLGCQKLDERVHIAGVILNRVGTRRHERVLRESIESICKVPVLGAVPRLAGEGLLPERHLGLVTPEEHREATDELENRLLAAVGDHLDLQRLLAIARQAPTMTTAPFVRSEPRSGRSVTIGYVRDSAFTFYYPENLEVLEAAGARLVSISALHDRQLPNDLDALYIGGGFPETHAIALSSNTSFLTSLKAQASSGLPIYAECGGLMLLSRAMRIGTETHAMAGVLPVDVEVHAAPQGHGYVQLTVDRPNAFFAIGESLKGHEFHYSQIRLENTAAAELPTAGEVSRGTGCFKGRDGIVVKNVWAAYTHVHALGAPQWAQGIASAARRYAIARRELVGV